MEVIQFESDEEFWSEHNKPAEFELWDENEEAYDIFEKCQTQWNVTMGGIIGLNYQSLEFILRLTAKPLDEQSELFELIRFIESGYLNAVNERKNNG